MRSATDGGAGLLDQIPGIALGEHLGRECRVQRVAATMDDQMADDRMADERQVADDVENLVADELVLEAQRVERPGLAEHDGVVERPAQRESALTHHLDVLEEAERARRGDVFGEALFRQSHGAALLTKQRMVEADRVGDLEVVRRVERDPLVALLERRSGARTRRYCLGVVNFLTPAS